MTVLTGHVLVPDLTGLPLLLYDQSAPDNMIQATKVVSITPLRTVEPNRRGFILYATCGRGPIIQFLNCFEGKISGQRIHYFQRERTNQTDQAYQRAHEWFGLTRDQLEMLVLLETPYPDGQFEEV